MLGEVLGRLPAHIEAHLLLDAALGQPASTAGTAHWLRALARRRIAFQQVAVPLWCARHHPDVLHGPFHTLPVATRVPRVVTLHDLAFEDHPEWYDRRRLWSFRLQARHAARAAAAVLTVSQHVADTIADRYGVASERILVAPNGISARHRAAAARSLDERRPLPPEHAHLADRGYVFALGGSPKRNVAMVLDVWREVRRRGHDVELVVLNEPSTGEPGLHTVQHPDDDTMEALLAGARAFLYPTGYEGFGLPALESAALGTPVVCARVGALPEVMGPSAAWSDQLSVASLADALEGVLADDARADDLVAAGRRRAVEVGGWERSVEAHVRAYELAAAEPRSSRSRSRWAAP